MPKNTPAPVLTIGLTSTTYVNSVFILDGVSNTPYAFAWDDSHGRYVYHAKTLAEANDIIENAGATAYHAFCILGAEPNRAATRVAPKPETAATLDRSQIVTLLNGHGLYAGPKETTEKLARIVEGLFAGYAAAADGQPMTIPPPKPAEVVDEHPHES